MNISYNWLKEFVSIDWSPEKTGALLTDLGLEVEIIQNFESVKGGLEGIVVGEILTCEKHPNADKLKTTTVNVGNETPLSIVCGAPNIAKGQKVAVALVGSIIYTDNDSFEIKKRKLRGEESCGMICSQKELGVGEDTSGIWVLDEEAIPGKPLKEIIEVITDAVFEIGLTPNRSDAMSHFGVARDLRAGLSQQGVSVNLIKPSVSTFHIDNRHLTINFNIEAPEKVKRFSGIGLIELKVEESPLWLQNRLKAIGLVPINNVVDVTNYVMHDLGQPLHAYDASKIKGHKMIVTTLPNGTKFTTLDGVERSLDKEDLMICNGEKEPMCIAGVFGGIDSGVTSETTSIFIEAACFDPISIRKTAKRHGLNTDASYRFERGIDINMIEYALKRVAMLMVEVAGGRISSEIMNYYPNKVQGKEIYLGFEKLKNITGVDAPEEKIREILNILDFKIRGLTGLGINLTVPTYRADVERDVDVIEEFLRIYGYNTVELPSKMSFSVESKTNRNFQIENQAAHHLIGQGFFEVMNNSLTHKKTSIAIKGVDENFVSILNPISKDLDVLRQTMLIGMLETLAFNINRKNQQLKFFEIGKTYQKSATTFEEFKKLDLLCSGTKTKDYWEENAKEVDFFYLKGIVSSLLEKLAITKVKTIPSENPLFIEGIDMEIKDKKLAEFGEIRPAILDSFNIDKRSFYATINWDLALSLAHETTMQFNEIPKYPAVKRDLALLIDNHITYRDIYNQIKALNNPIIKEVDLFDVYEGEQLKSGTKSYAISLTLLSETKTLNEKEITNTMEEVQKKLNEKLGATLR